MSTQRTPPFMKRLLLVAALALIAVALPLGLAAAQAPAQVTFANVPFRGVAAPASPFDLVESVIDFSPAAKSPTVAATAAYYLSVIEGELTIDVDGKPETVAVGKGVSAPARAKVTISNASTGTRGRLLVSTLLGVAAVDDVHQLSSVGVKVFATARRTVKNVPPVVDVIQQAIRYDPGWRTGNHTMNELHLFITLSGTTDFGYLDGGLERFGPGLQAVMHEGHAGWMANNTQASSSFVNTWLGTPGKPLTSAVTGPPAATPVPVAPRPPSTGTGVAPTSDADSGVFGRTTLSLGSLAVVIGVLASGAFVKTQRAGKRRAG